MELFSSFKTLSNRYSILKNEFLETEKSLAKFMSYENKISPEFKKWPITPPQRHIPLRETFNKQTNYSTSSKSSEESLSEDDSLPKKVVLQSAIITKKAGPQSRREVISEQNSSFKMQSRNHRILGLVQSTLQKFQNEERERWPQDLKRKKILEKVEAAEEKEKQMAKKQKMELLFKTREQQLQLECLEKMMYITESFELWEQNQKYLLNFNLTKAWPQICFSPVMHTPNSKKHLEISRTEIQENIEEQKAAVEVSLARIRDSYQLTFPVHLDWNTSPKSYQVQTSAKPYRVHATSPKSYRVHAASPNFYGVHAVSPNSYGVHSTSPKSYRVHSTSPKSYGMHSTSPKSYRVHSTSPKSYRVHVNKTDFHSNIDMGYYKEKKPSVAEETYSSFSEDKSDNMFFHNMLY